MRFARKARFWKTSRSDGAAPVEQNDRKQSNHAVKEKGPEARPMASKGADDMWVEAEKRLRQDERMSRVMDEAVGILEEYGLHLAPGSTAGRQQLSDFLDIRVDELQQKKWMVRVGGHSIGVQEQLTKMFKNVLAFKDMITTAAAASPPAAIVCASMAVSMQLFIQAAEHHDQLLDGLEKTSALIPRLLVTERLYLHSNPALEDEFINKFRERLVLLYSKVLELQVRALSYLRRRPLSRVSRDILQQDPWGALLADMKSLEREAESFKILIDKADLNETNEKIHREIQAAVDGLQAWQTKSTRDEKVKKLFNMLYTSPYRDRKDRNVKNVPGTCGWFTGHPWFRAWIESHQQDFLWASADPGCGKSVLARHLVDEALVTAGDRTICYFFFKDDFSDQQSSASAIACVLRQLFLAKPHLLPDAVLDRIDTDGEQLIQSFHQLWSIFVSAAAHPSAGEVVCIIDALDECLNNDRHPDRSQFIEAVTNLYRDRRKRSKLKFLITSRPYADIRSAFQELEDQMSTIHLSGEGEPEVEKISREIDLVIASRVHGMSKKKSLSPDERQFLLEQLTAVPNRTYLWVSLTLDYLEGIPGFTKGNVRRAVHSEIPHTVDEAYNKILSRSPDQAKAKRLLHIITAAKRPLSLQELSICMALRGENQSKQDIMDETEPIRRFKHTVRDLCGLLLTIVDDKIYLLHQTVKEFLVQPQPPPSPLTPSQNDWKHALVPTESNKVLAEICVWYLHVAVEVAGRKVLYVYSACYWPVHFREASFQNQDKMVVLGRRLCTTGTTIYTFWSTVYARITFDFPVDATPLIIAAALGLEAVVRLLLEAGTAQADSTDSKNRTPLSWAAENGHESVLKLLIETGKVKVDSVDSRSRSPLSYASENGHEAIVKLLLNTREVDVKSPIEPAYLAHPLFLAINSGHVAVARLLLAGKANVNTSHYCRTPLMEASRLGDISIVQLLLEYDEVEINWMDARGQTALSLAAENGHHEIVRILLDTGKADAGSMDLDYETPLSRAAQWGHELMVSLLLDSGRVEVNTKHYHGQSPLLLAAQHGHEPVVRMLLATGRAEVDTRGHDGRSALSWAARGGYESVVELLIKTGQVEIDSRDAEGRTPLSLAAGNGHEEVVRLLLATGCVQVDAEDWSGRSPLSRAIESRRERIVQMLRDA